MKSEAETKATTGSGEDRLELVISYILIIGVIVSLLLTVAGLVYYHSHGNLSISLNNPSMFIHGDNFFSFIGKLTSGGTSHDKTIFYITLGIMILILTPYIRVIASAFYFGVRKDIKYVVITLYVLIVLTLSLLLH